MKTRRYALAAAVLGLLALISPRSAKADDIERISFSLTFDGVNSCAGLCEEIFSASVLWDNKTTQVVPNSDQPMFSGPLIGFSFDNGSSGLINNGLGRPQSVQLAWRDSGGDAIFIDLFTDTGNLSAGPYLVTDIVPAAGNAEGGWSCFTAICNSDFPENATSVAGTASVAPVPEPSSLLLLGTGLLGLAGAMRRKRLA